MLLCFDIGGSWIKAAVHSGKGLQPLGAVPTPINDFDEFLAALKGFSVGFPISAVAISIAGVVDSDTGLIKVANIPCANGRGLGQELRRALALPVLVLNDADCFALAEARQGAAQGHRNVFGLILGTGVGGGLVLGGRLVQGAGGYAGELGHGPVVTGQWSRPCGCGLTGCLDAVCGARGLELLHQDLNGITASSNQILMAWEEGDPLAAQTIDLWLDLLSGPLAMVLNVVGASIVPVGGGLANVTALVAALDARVRPLVLRSAERPLLVPAQCAHEPGLIGAAEAGREVFG